MTTATSWLTAKTIYSAAQASLSQYQRLNPEASMTILRIQRVALIFDTVCLVSDLAEVYETFRERVKKNEFWRQAAGILSTVAVVAVSLYAVSKLNSFYKPVVDLTTLLKEIAPSADFTVNWTTPRWHTITQWIIASRLVSNTVLALFSSNRTHYVFSALCLGNTLDNISQLSWIVAEKAISSVSEHAQNYSPSKLSLKGKVSLEFLVPSRCSSTVDHLKSHLQNIAQYMTTDFELKQITPNFTPTPDYWIPVQTSTYWGRASGGYPRHNWTYIPVYTTNRFHLSSFNATLPTPNLGNCDCGVPTFFSKAIGQGIEQTLGTIPLKVVSE